jgi:very-short-patch-repair endonuclease
MCITVRAARRRDKCEMGDTAARLARILESQHGVISRSQALASGLTRKGIEIRLRNGSWRSNLPHTYAIAGAPRTWKQRLMEACLWAGETALASHRAAAALWNLPGFTERFIEITTTKHLSSEVVSVHRTTTISGMDVVSRDGIPVTAPHRTIIDLCAVVHPQLVEESLDVFLVRGQTEIDFLWRQLNRIGSVGRCGTARLRTMLAERAGRIIHPGSSSESRLLSLLRDAGVIGARPQIEIFDGDTFVARPDVVFEDVALAIEVDSWTWHTDKTRRRADARRQNQLERMGWTVLRFFREDIYFDPDYVVAEICATLHALRSRVTF